MDKFSSGMLKVQSPELRFEIIPWKINRGEEANYFSNTCNLIEAEPFSAIIDLSWGGWKEIQNQAIYNGMPYLRLDAANHQFVKVHLVYLTC